MIRKLLKRHEAATHQDGNSRKSSAKLGALSLTPGEAVEVKIDFTYSFVEKGKKWVDIVSLKKSDKEAAFVFRVNQENEFFQVYFGDGTKVQGELKIDTHGFVDCDSTLKYFRNQDFTCVSLECRERKEVRFAMHKGKIAADIPSDKYREGRAESGIEVRKVEHVQLPASDVSLDIAKAFLADTCAKRSAGYYRSMNTLGAAYFDSKEYQKALEIFAEISSASCSNIDQVAFPKARSCINSIYKSPERARAWGIFSSPEDDLFGRSRKAVADGDIEVAVLAFSDAVKSVLGGPVYQFDKDRQAGLINAFTSLVAEEGVGAVELPQFKTAKVAIVSGIGWSGSGAVYDYLKEFAGVVAIKGETPYIEGSQSLRTIYASLGDRQKLRERLFDFFFYALVGHCGFRGAGDFKLFKHARRHLLGDRCEQYLEAVQGWCLFARWVCDAEGEERYHRFVTLADYTVNKFSIGRELPEGKVALLDNVVHTVNSAECINFLRNVTMFCTFRDPRSNYVALVREASHFTSGAASYVEEWKKRIGKALRMARLAEQSASKVNGTAVEIVNFEEFVLFEGYRSRLAKELGLSSYGQAKYKYFKPWESLRNVLLHYEHPDQSEIKLIENELGEHCYELCIRPLKEKTPIEGDQCVI